MLHESNVPCAGQTIVLRALLLKASNEDTKSSAEELNDTVVSAEQFETLTDEGFRSVDGNASEVSAGLLRMKIEQFARASAVTLASLAFDSMVKDDTLARLGSESDARAAWPLTPTSGTLHSAGNDKSMSAELLLIATFFAICSFGAVTVDKRVFRST